MDINIIREYIHIYSYLSVCIHVCMYIRKVYKQEKIHIKKEDTRILRKIPENVAFHPDIMSIDDILQRFSLQISI